jgi:hypothetical protein
VARFGVQGEREAATKALWQGARAQRDPDCALFVAEGTGTAACAAGADGAPAVRDTPARPEERWRARMPYEDEGRADLLGRLGIGLTNRGPVGGCGPSSGQGLDAWVFELPTDGPGAGAPVKATGSDLPGLHNLAVVVLSADCEGGGLIVAAVNGSGTVGAGALAPPARDRQISARFEQTVALARRFSEHS